LELEFSADHEDVLGADLESRVGDLDFEDEEAYGFEGTHDEGGLGLADLGREQAETEVIGPDSRVRVHTTVKPPFCYVCNLEYDLPGIGLRSVCTGTLIGPRTVLTAGHCIAGLKPGRLRVIPGRNGSLEPLPATRAKALIPFPGYVGATPTDVGIIHLVDPIGASVGYWSQSHTRSRRDSIGTSILSGPLPLPAGKLKVNLSGYPADKPGGNKYWCRDPKRPRSRCRHSRLSDPKRSAVCGTLQYRAYGLLVKKVGRILHYLNDTCPGHSGSPVWVRRHPSKGGRVLIAVHIAGDAPPSPVANRAVMIDSVVRKFIVANTK